VTISAAAISQDNFEPPPPVLFEEVDQMAMEIDATEFDAIKIKETGIACQTERSEVDAKCQTEPMPLQGGILSIQRIKNDPDAVKLFTGFSDYDHFLYLYQCLGPATEHLLYKSVLLGPQDELFLCLMKLRMNKDDMELGILFGISRSTAGRVFGTWLNFLFYQLKEIDIFVPREIVKQYMPEDFNTKFPNTRIILDATEVKMQKPSKVDDQRATWSSYKNSNTLKTMIGTSPRGVVTYVSPSYGGSCSDRQIIEISPLLRGSMFSAGDEIMADRGIMVQDLFASQDVKVNTPRTMKGKNQLEPEVVIEDRRIASKRVHVERVIGLAKTYKILAADLEHSKTPIGGRIVFVCFVLCNFRKNIVPKYC
jgi:hypothetical protein